MHHLRYLLEVQVREDFNLFFTLKLDTKLGKFKIFIKAGKKRKKYFMLFQTEMGKRGKYSTLPINLLWIVAMK